MTTNRTERSLDTIDFPSRLRLDKHALDEAIAEQADLYYQIAEEHAQARDIVERAKATLDEVDSSLALALRAAADKAGTKLTEARISEQVLTSEEHVANATALADERLSAERWGALRDAFGQRASMIKVLADLYVAGYFSLSSAGSSQTKVAGADADQGRTAMTLRRKKLEKA